MPGLHPIYRLWRVFILRAARASLTRHNPFHADLPGIVVELNQLERRA